MSYRVGSVKKTIAKDGKEYFAGKICIPVIGFWGKKSDNQDVIYFSLDYEKAKYLDEHKKNKEDNKPQEEIKQQ